MEIDYKIPEDEMLYEEIKRKKAMLQERSLNGSRVEHRRKKIKINPKRFIPSVVLMISITVGGTLAASNVAKDMRKAIQDNQIYNTMLDEYDKEVFSKAIHHVDGTVGEIYIDYDLLADSINEAKDNDILNDDVLLSFNQHLIEGLNLSDDENQMNKIVEKTDLGVDSYDEYLRNKGYLGYDENKEFVKDIKNTFIDNSKNINNLEKEASASLDGGMSL